MMPAANTMVLRADGWVPREPTDFFSALQQKFAAPDKCAGVLRWTIWPSNQCHHRAGRPNGQRAVVFKSVFNPRDDDAGHGC